MTKRAHEEEIESVSKKLRVNPELEAMKATLDNLLQSANEHHEEARIAAIDAASELEEQWTEATSARDKTKIEHDAVEGEFGAAVQYLDTFENSATVQMLKKASENKTVGTLVQDHESIRDALTKMQNMKKRLSSTLTELDRTLQKETETAAALKEKLTAAEARVETITSFG